MDEKEKKDTLEFFDKLLDLKFQSEDLIEKADELIERCEIDTKKEEAAAEVLPGGVAVQRGV